MNTTYHQGLRWRVDMLVAALFATQFLLAMPGHAQAGSRHVSTVETTITLNTIQKDPSLELEERWRQACKTDLIYRCEKGATGSYLLPSLGHGDRLKCPWDAARDRRGVEFQRFNHNTFNLLDINQNGGNIPYWFPILGQANWARSLSYDISCTGNCVTKCSENCPYADANSCLSACQSENGDCAACVESEPGCFTCESEPECDCEFPDVNACQSSGCLDCVADGDCYTCNDDKPEPPGTGPGRPEITVPTTPIVPGPESCPHNTTCVRSCNGKPTRGLWTFIPLTGECLCAVVCTGGTFPIGGGPGGSCSVQIGTLCPATCSSCSYYLF